MAADQKYKDGDGLSQTFETTNGAEIMFFTDRCQVYKTRLSEFEDTKASALGDYLPAKLSMDSGENVIYAVLPDSGAAEGLPRRLTEAARTSGSMEEFCAAAKTKRYTHARIRRLVLWAFLGLTAADRPSSPPYLRVLGFNRRGQALLREMREKANLPVLVKSAHARRMPESAKQLFELEARCTDLYALCSPLPRPCGLEWTTGPVIPDM